MPKAVSSKAKAAAAALSGPPALYEEALSGPLLVVEVTALSAWRTTPSADASSKGFSTGGARWGHTAMLSPSGSVLCVVGGTPFHEPDVTEQPPAPLWEYTSVTAMTAPTATYTSVVKTPVASAALSAAPVWRPVAASLATRRSTICSADTAADGQHEWPLFASWWTSWPSGNGSDGPSVMYADGGWNGVRRVAGVRVFTSGADGVPGLTLPTVCAVDATGTRSHHSVTCVQGRLLRFGGETQRPAAAALEEIGGASVFADAKQPAEEEHRSADGRDAGAPLAATVRGEVAPLQSTSTAPRLPPPRAAHGACSLNQRYMVIVGGRQVHTQADDVDAAAAGASAGKGPRAKKSTSMRTLSTGKRGGMGAKDGKCTAAALEPSAPASATFTTLKDVAIYDAKIGAWLPVRVVGGGAVPRARYAAAVAAVPMPNAASPTCLRRSPAADAVQREVLVIGGLDAGGAICADAWVMQVMSGTDAEIAEVPTGTPAGSASTAVPLVKVRWVRLELPVAAASVFQRHHAAVAVSSQRVVYLVGGCGPHGAAEPCVCTLELPPLTTASVRLANETGGDAEGAAQKQPPSGSKGRSA
ncbi:hypothetical protein GH5_07314 [Leishmania sp. Ghana 2012 LV757]|uniref:hypothetical protein n=1 Tax=Leishmania sp. Ghana 2012 LV757 TaxID=2803181 RepID=UPI001B535B49|nr:hypothetical protein GH5_07314 [Leishmania sp. Ghana 2012 LV757]